jgi:hypothetical protein
MHAAEGVGLLGRTGPQAQQLPRGSQRLVLSYDGDDDVRAPALKAPCMHARTQKHFNCAAIVFFLRV